MNLITFTGQSESLTVRVTCYGSKAVSVQLFIVNGRYKIICDRRVYIFNSVYVVLTDSHRLMMQKPTQHRCVVGF